ncbi:MAG: holo-ACP synthase [Alphaproteobacteria bacterium]
MILGIGTDIIDIRRIEALLEKSGDKFIARTFTQGEQALARSRANGGLEAAAYAKRFAAKEACAKALGTAIREGIAFLDFEILNDANGKPELTLHGAAKNILAQKTPQGAAAAIHLSLSDEHPYALAYVVISYLPQTHIASGQAMADTVRTQDT